MLLHPPQLPLPSSAIAHYNVLQQPSVAPLPIHPRATPRSLAAVDNLPFHPLHNANRAEEHRHTDSPLEPPHSYHYVPRPQPAQSSPSPDAMYHHPHAQSLYDEQHQHQQHHNPQATQTIPPPPNGPSDFDLPRQQPPSIHTGNLLYPTDSANYTPSPLSSPTENPITSQSSASRQFSFPQPMSAPHNQGAFARYENDPALPRFPYSNQTLDRRMSEPVLGAGRQTYAQPPPPAHHDTFAYSAASSATMIQSSPRPSSSYSSYGSYPGHERDNSGASIGSAGVPEPYAHSAAPAWGSGIKHADLDQDSALTSSPLSPLYAASAASGSDASVTGLPSPPSQSRPSPSIPSAQTSTRPPQPSQTSPNTPRSSANSKTYSFVSLPGNAVKKRPRRRYDEIERLYQCSWPGCTKAYGTLNHLNAHVTMQRHGSKRSPNEFKELRKQWRQQKKEQEEQEREREREAVHAQAMAMQQFAHHAQMTEYDHHRHVRRRLSMVEPYPDPHAHPHSLPGHSYLHNAMQGQGPGPGPVQSAFGGQPQSAPSFSSLQGPGMGMEARYGLTSPADELSQFRYPQSQHSQVSQGLPSMNMHHAAGPEDDIYFRNPAGPGQPLPPQHGEPVGPSWGTPHPPHQHAHPPTPGSQHHYAHGIRPIQPFYTGSGASSSITLPPPHALGGLSVSAPNPSPLSSSTFPPLGPSTGPGPALGGPQEVSLGLPTPVGPSTESGSPTPELAAHVSLGSNRLPPDSTLLTPLPGYEPEMEHGDIERVRDDHDRDRVRDYVRDRDDRDRNAWDRGRERDRYNGQGNGRDQQYE